MRVSQKPVSEHHGYPNGRSRAVSETELGHSGYPVVFHQRFIDPAHIKIEGSVERGEHLLFALPRLAFVRAPKNDVVGASFRDHLEIRPSKCIQQLICFGSQLTGRSSGGASNPYTLEWEIPSRS